MKAERARGEALRADNEALKERLAHLEQVISELRRLQFGASSEKRDDQP